MIAALTVLLVLAGAACGRVAPPGQAPPETASVARPAPLAEGRITARELMDVVAELASPRYEGRRTGTPGGILARGYVNAAFAAIGLEPAGTRKYEQRFQFKDVTDAANLIGRVPGTDPSAKAIVLTAHYDHDGIKAGELYPGADDNASGVAALLAIARQITSRPLRHTLIIAALDAEEQGLQGAQAFITTPPLPLERIALNVNLDMVSRNDRSEIYAAGTWHRPWLRPILEDVGRRANLTLRFGHDAPKKAPSDPDDWTLQSDHGIFHKAGIPFVYFGVEDHPDYHKPGDTADKIDPVFFTNVVEMILDAVETLDTRLPATADGARGPIDESAPVHTAR